MADLKRKYYNTGDTKGFTKAVFYKVVKAMAENDITQDLIDMVPSAKDEQDLIDLVGAAATYELEGIDTRAASKPAGKKDVMESDYAKALIAAVLPLLTNEAQTSKEIVAKATAKGMLAPSGKEFAGPWVSRILSHFAEERQHNVVSMKKVVTRIDNKGLQQQGEVTGYKLG